MRVTNLFDLTPRRNKGAAFTLLELLVAMTVLSLLLVILATMVDNTTKLWRQTENRVDSYREARAALNVIAADLRSIYVPKDPNLFTLNNGNGLPTSAVSPPVAGAIFFLTATPSDAQDPDVTGSGPQNKSDLCAVGYFLAYDTPSLGNIKRSLNLYRYFRSSTPTFDFIRNKQPLIDSKIATGPSGEEVLARNVTGFRIRGYTVNATSGQATEIGPGKTDIPDYVDIELTAINNDAAKRMPDKKEDWLKTDSNIFKQNARTFSTRINISKP